MTALIGIFLGLYAALLCDAGVVDIIDRVTNVTQNQGSGSLNISLSEIVQTNAVNVTCYQLQSGPRNSNIQFEHLIVPVGSKDSNMNFSIVSAGDAVDVVCYGISLNDGNQYLQINSSGQTGKIIVTSAPTVSICEDYIYVKGYTNDFQFFNVRLSEPAISPVIVECFSTTATNASSLLVEFSRATISQQQTQVPFRVRRSGSPVKVSCRAQISSCLKTQSSSTFIPAFSSTPAVFPSFAVSATFSSSAIDVSSINASFSTAVPAFDSAAVSVASMTLSGAVPNATPSANLASASSASATTSVFASSAISNASSNASSIVKENVTISPSVISKSSVSVLSPAPTLLPPTSTPAPSSGACQFLFTTSTGAAVTFIVQQATISAFPSYTDFGHLKKHLTYISLDKALEGTLDMELRCAIRAVNITEIEDAVCNAGLPISGSGEVVLSQVTLKLLESKIIFKPGDIFKNITVQVSALGNNSFSQLFHAYCCAPTSNAKYTGQTVSVFLWMDTKGRIPYDWLKVPDQAQRRITAVESLDFSCPCNLNANICDLNCCCDKDCTTAEIQRFVCTEGAFGGREKNSFEFDCNAVWPERRDWTPFLCVVTNNSPFLGYFFKYTSPAIASTSSDMGKLVAGKTQFSYEENEARTSSLSSTIGYEYGSPIKTNIGLFSIPSQPGDNSCRFTSIRYLQDTKSYCICRSVQETCSQPSFNALNYLLPTGLTVPACTVPGILSGQTATSLAAKNVEYYCLTSSSEYISLQGNAYSQGIARESLFPGTSVTTSSIQRCSFDNSKTRPPQPSFHNATKTCENAVLDVKYDNHWNAKELKSVVAKITLGNIPINAVTQTAVTYTYYTQRVFTVTPSSTKAVFTPTFSPSSLSVALRPTYVPSVSYNATSIISIGASLKNSISPSVPVLSTVPSRSATPLANASASVFASQSTLPSPSFRLSSSSVENSTKPNRVNILTITIKTSTVIQRTITITPSVHQRFTVSFKYQKSVASVGINASVSLNVSQTLPSVSRSGNPGYVLGKPLVTQTNSTLNATSTLGLLLWKAKSDGLCASSTKVPVQFGKNSVSGCTLYIGLDRFQNCSSLRDLVLENQRKLVEATRIAKRGNPSVDKNEDWLNIIKTEPAVSTPTLTRVGICHDIPAHTVVELLVSEAGMTYGESQMEISGARVRFMQETWSVNCASGSGSQCYNSTAASSKFTNPFVRSFFVTSSVVFVKIPAVDPPRVKRSVDTSGICKYDTCLKEMFYPLKNVYSAGIVNFTLQITQDATAMAMTLIFIAFGALYVSGPWRR